MEVVQYSGGIAAALQEDSISTLGIASVLWRDSISAVGDSISTVGDSISTAEK